jgi:hypothetical protein
MFSRIFDRKPTELDMQIEKLVAARATDQRRQLMGMLTNSSGLFNPAAAGQANMINSIGATAQAGILREEPRDHAVRVEYVPVENGYVVNIAKGFNQVAKVYVAKDLAEAHELVTTFMVKERLK